MPAEFVWKEGVLQLLLLCSVVCVCVCVCVYVRVCNVFNVHDINLVTHLVLPVLFRHLQYEYLSTCN